MSVEENIRSVSRHALLKYRSNLLSSHPTSADPRRSTARAWRRFHVSCAVVFAGVPASGARRLGGQYPARGQGLTVWQVGTQAVMYKYDKHDTKILLQRIDHFRNQMDCILYGHIDAARSQTGW